jgi:hypothetical protein
MLLIVDSVEEDNNLVLAPAMTEYLKRMKNL